MIVFDGHNDTLTYLYRETPDDWKPFLTGGTAGHVDLPRARSGELAGGFFAIFTPPPPDSPERDPMYGLTDAGKALVDACNYRGMSAAGVSAG